MKEEVFITIELPVSGRVTILEGKGRHYFSAITKANGDSTLMIKYLIIEVVKIDGKSLSEVQLDEMHMRDVCYLSTVIGTMMSNDFVNGI